MKTCHCGRVARYHITGEGGRGPPVNEHVCDQHFNQAQRAAQRHPTRTAALINKNVPDDLLDLINHTEGTP